MNAEEDKKKKELVEARNSADALIYSTEKSIKELGDKVDSETKSKVEDASAALKKAMEGEGTEEIKRLSEELTQISHKLAEAMYQQASASEQQGNAGAESADQAGGAAPEEDVVDADFEEVKEDDKK
jgi:molecular chaperone DnaK